MKKFSLLLAIMLLLMAVIPASAQTPSKTTKAPGAWVSSINIQNTGTADATVVLRFYNADGTMVKEDTTSISGANVIKAGGSRTIVLASDEKDLPPGQYSVVVESSQPLEVIANSTSTGPATAGAYQGVKQTELGTVLYFPGLYKTYYGFSSELVVQNSDATNAATVTIEYFAQSTGAPIPGATLVSQSIPANSTRIFPLADNAGIPGGPAGLVSAKVTSTGGQKLAGIANVWTGAMYGEFGDYNGYLGGATTIYAPALYNAYYGFMSALTVMNLGNVATNIQVTYSNGLTETVATLAPFQAKQYVQLGRAGLPSGSGGVFSAKVVSTGVSGNAAQPVVALVNVENKSTGLFASYNAPSATSTTVGCPVTMQSYYGWFTAETVQNVGGAPTDVTITYPGGQTNTFRGVPANGTINIVELPPGTVMPNTSSVSAKITATQPLVVIVQENSNRYSTAPGDYLLAYTCVGQ